MKHCMKKRTRIRRILSMLLAVVLCTSLAACGGSDAAKRLEDIAATTAAANAADSANAADTAAEKNESAAQSGIDVDLTTMSSTMVYSQVANMVSEPTEYLGKTIKVKGLFNASYFEGTGRYYFYVIIADATACCQQGLEFIWEDGSHSYPGDYPAENTPIELVGTYQTYTEQSVTYYYIQTDQLKVTG